MVESVESDNHMTAQQHQELLLRVKQLSSVRDTLVQINHNLQMMLGLANEQIIAINNILGITEPSNGKKNLAPALGVLAASQMNTSMTTYRACRVLGGSV